MAGKLSRDEKHNWLEGLLEKYQSHLIRYVYRILFDLELSREVVQESFLKLWQQDHAKVNPMLPQWLYTVCRNRAIDIKRKDGPMSQFRQNEEGQLQAHDDIPSEAYAKKQSQNQVMKKVLELPEKHREVALLKFQDGLSYQEISKITGHSVSYVGVLVHEAVTQLRKELKGGLQ